MCEKFRPPTFLAVSIFHTSKTKSTILNPSLISHKKPKRLKLQALQVLEPVPKFLQNVATEMKNPAARLTDITEDNRRCWKVHERNEAGIRFLLLRLRDRKKMGGWGEKGEGTAADRRQETRTVCCCGRFGWRSSLAFAEGFCHVAAL